MTQASHSGFFHRLLRDTAANTLAISAAAVVPLIGVIGGSIDAGRMYMAKSRLQQACDSATLAARKKLEGTDIRSGTIPSDVQTTARNFFDTNFQPGTYGTMDTTYTLTTPGGTQLDGVATTKIPTTLMAVFGFEDVAIDAECSADLGLPNIDVVLVLDNSGSMIGTPLAALKDAVFAFYDEIMAVAPAGSQIRIGIVPYNASVNVGDMVSELNPNYIADRWTYQSREPIYRREVDNTGNSGSLVISVNGELISDKVDSLPKLTSNLGSNNFSGLGSNNFYRWSSNPNSDPYGRNDCELDYPGTYTVGSERWVISGTRLRNIGWPANFGDPNWRGLCTGRIQKYRAVPGVPNAVPVTYREVFDHYEYKPIVFDTSLFKQGGTVSQTFAYVNGNRVPMPTGQEGANTAPSRWNKCIEEATTVTATSFNPIPAGAYDLNIDLVPNPSDPDTQWRPMWPELTYNRGGAAARSVTQAESLNFPFFNAWRQVFPNCPAARAWPLQEYDLQGSNRNPAFEARINAMTAQTSDFTMHDIGMIWGGRIISPNGIFAATNATAPNGDPISRHIIFMTDGNTSVFPGVYHSYGNYNMDGRFIGFKPNGAWTQEDVTPIHNARLAAVCNQIKNKNVTMWSVNFGLPQNVNTRNCASGDSRAFESDNRAQLVSNFRRIATNIAELRLVD